MEDSTYNKILAEFQAMAKDVASWEEKGNKSACKRVRKTCSAIAKELKEWRSQLLEASKD